MPLQIPDNSVVEPEQGSTMVQIGTWPQGTYANLNPVGAIVADTVELNTGVIVGFPYN